MKKYCITMVPVLVIVLVLFIGFSAAGSKGITVMAENAPIRGRKTVIIDPGHGGEDGGSSTKNGVAESKINLEIAIRLRDVMNLVGINTKMIRTEDISIYTSGQNLAQKKVSDLKERVRIANSTPNSIYVSIHQNYFTNEKYSGAQVFYGKNTASKEIAANLQEAFCSYLSSKRSVKQSKGIYIMENIEIPCVLVECGFLSNDQEASLLQKAEYQKNISALIACVCSEYLADS